MPKIKVGIVGCGTIGSYLALFVSRKLKRSVELSGLYDIDPSRARALSRKACSSERLAVADLKKLIARSRLVIESAGASGVLAVAREALKAGRDVMIMSTGGISGHIKEITRLAQRHSAKVYIPSGAIAGIDAVKAAFLGGIESVTLVTTKNPGSFARSAYLQSKKIDPRKIRKDTVLFSGTAQEAVKYFPQNINVAAVLGLAGVGAARTRVKIIASPAARSNTHQITVCCRAGTISATTQNVPHPTNPKTSFLAALSAAATLQKIAEPVVIGT
ncbi:MAG: DUF108 domain-containing protein [Candidatus Omnitrophica bacterium]|nr:DUF108 domain-containing protein [Candidatus Omnitrophota bacterium]